MAQIDENTGEVLSDGFDIVQQLDMLDEMEAQLSIIEQDKQKMIDSVLTPEIIAQIADIEEEFADKIEAVKKKIAVMENVIKENCVAHGNTVKGGYLQVVYSKGREGGWNTEGLKGYSVNHPEILQFKKPDGKPSASIRKGGTKS